MSKASNDNQKNGEIVKKVAIVGACIAGALFVAKFVLNYRKKKNNEGVSTSYKSKGYDSLIPFTLKASDQPAVQGDNLFATVDYERLPLDIAYKRSCDYFKFMNMRRSFRHFSSEKVDFKIIERCIAVANTAPSGAHTSPWTFIVVTNKKKQNAIRQVVEKEEQINYERRMKKTWVHKLEPVISNLHTIDDVKKPYLSNAPCLIIVMKEMYRYDAKSGKKIDNYYPNQSTGIACGLLFGALHNANLVSLPSTPMGAEKAIREICGRKQNEKVFLLVPIGYPHKDATIPFRTEKTWRKDLNKSMIVID